MSEARTQDKRYWIQLECPPTGESRRILHLDLNMVDEVMVVNGPNPDDPQDKDFAQGVRVTYAGVMKPIDLDNRPSFKVNAANDFYKMWKAFIQLRDKAAPGVIGVIHLPQSVLFKN